MASILTNTGAMVALQSLRSTNAGLSKVQTEISTGKKVATAKDNAATFAISNVMKSDVAGFKALTESLDLGASTVAVASNAAFQVGELLNEIKGKIISANEENVDRTKLNNEVTSLRDQINGIVSSAQFNGLNLVNGTTNASGFTVLASLDRDASGVVSTNTIGVVTANTDLSTATGTDLTAGTNPATTDTNPNTAALIEAGDTNVLGGFTTLDAAGAVVATGGPALAADAVDLTAGTAQDALVEGDQITVTIGNVTGKYTVIAGDRSTDIVAGLRQSLVDKGIDSSDYTLDTGTTAGSLTITNNTTVDANYSYTITRGAGGLAGLDTIDVSSAAGAAQALNDVEGFIQTAIDAQAALGTAERRLTIQNDFLAGQIDNFEAGIGALVDADLEEASARLQSLQVQQQLGVQALSIANQAPQSILALFR